VGYTVPPRLRKFLKFLTFVVVFGGLIVLARNLSGVAATVTWIVWLLSLVAAFFLFGSIDPKLYLDDAAKQTFTVWKAAHPDRNVDWTAQPVPERTWGWGSSDQQRPDLALLGRFGGKPPFNYDTRNMDEARATFVARTTVDGLDLLLLEQGWMDAYKVPSDLTVSVSLDTPGRCQRVSIFRRAGYQRTGWYRALAFWRFSTGDLAFDTRFNVIVDDRQEARRLLAPALRRFLVTDPRAVHLGITLERGTCNVWLKGQFDVVAVPPMIDYLVSLYRLIPSQFWTNLVTAS
jgi:hypothetical protein